ncbi:MAG: hypothetical protein R3F17_16750 [Planctomycetota bacterium]
MKGLDADLRALQEVRDLVAFGTKAAVKAVAGYGQADVDRLCAAMADAGAKAAPRSGARMAVQETGFGRLHYKILKNLFGSEGTWASIQHERTVGVLSSSTRTPVSPRWPRPWASWRGSSQHEPHRRPFKAIISVKGRNGIAQPALPARRCILQAAEVLRRAIERKRAAAGPGHLPRAADPSNPPAP